MVIIEIVAVSLYTAWINDASKDPSATLNAVASATYNVEVSTKFR